MLVVTDRGASALLELLGDSGAGAVVHISEDSPPPDGGVPTPSFRLEVVDEPPPQTTQVIAAPHGVHVSIDANAAPDLENSVLDGEIDLDGELVFSIKHRG